MAVIRARSGGTVTSSTTSKRSSSDRARRPSAAWWFVAGVAVGGVLALTLFPGSPAPYRWAVNELSPWIGPRRLAVALNVALFVPVGVVLGWLSRPRLLLLAPVASLVIEGVQWLLPQRHPDPLDIAANTLGAVLGYLGVVLVRGLASALRGGVQRYRRRRRGDYALRSQR